MARRGPEDLAQQAAVSATSELQLIHLPIGESVAVCDRSRAQMLPVIPGKAPRMTCWLSVEKETTVEMQLHLASKKDNHTPDVIVAAKQVNIPAGVQQPVVIDFDITIDEPRWAFYCIMVNPAASVHLSDQRVTSLLSLKHRGDQKPERDIGVEEFEFWTPDRRPAGQNFAFTLDRPIAAFAASNVTDGVGRPTDHPHAWVASFEEKAPALTLQWSAPQCIALIDLVFDCDFDHPMESVLWGHPERCVPFCVQHYRILADGHTIYECHDNHQSFNAIRLDQPIFTDSLTIQCLASHRDIPSAIFEVSCYDCTSSNSSTVDRVAH